jgi:hypothetical protein
MNLVCNLIHAELQRRQLIEKGDSPYPEWTFHFLSAVLQRDPEQNCGFYPFDSTGTHFSGRQNHCYYQSDLFPGWMVTCPGTRPSEAENRPICKIGWVAPEELEGEANDNVNVQWLFIQDYNYKKHGNINRNQSK